MEPWPQRTSLARISRLGTECASAPSESTRFRLVCMASEPCPSGSMRMRPVNTERAASPTAPFRYMLEVVCGARWPT